jgi:hypothetical protein
MTKKYVARCYELNIDPYDQPDAFYDNVSTYIRIFIDTYRDKKLIHICYYIYTCR